MFWRVGDVWRSIVGGAPPKKCVVSISKTGKNTLLSKNYSNDLFFSHNGGLPDGTSYSRSIIAEPVSYDNNGRIRRIPATAEGVSIR